MRNGLWSLELITKFYVLNYVEYWPVGNNNSLLHPFNVTIRSDRRGTCKGTHVVYACVGYCESSAFPSRYSVLVASNFTHNITSASRCCTISKDAKIKVRLDCPRARHHDDIEILTARACHCDMCRKSRY
uniref:Glycoprotein hormones alpha chain n=1 Tax=Hucho hucho TaxID=62062 RepID=A0A4W5RD93_9TELE